jgi:ubiquinone/menaquinone biosynthesis C-methylase UbiE
MNPQPSISFDHAADFYDSTRALDDEIAEKLTDAIFSELQAANAEHLLEVGVGTGRISRPLMERGLRVTGIDIAPRMIARLLTQLTAAHLAPDLALADATALPFRDASFPAVLNAHVLHLIPPWQQAVSEMRRALAPGGVILSHFEHRPDDNDVWDPFYDWWDESLAQRGFEGRPRPKPEEIDDEFGRHGGAGRTITVAESVEKPSVGEELELTRNRIHSWTWEIPDDLFRELQPQHEKWALEHLGGPDIISPRRVEFRLQVWRFA